MRCAEVACQFLVPVIIFGFLGLGGCAKAAKPDQVITLDLTGPRPIALLKVGDLAPVKAIFDTGAGASVVNLKFARQLRLPDLGEVDVGSPGATAPVKGMMTSLSAARLGDAQIESGRAVAIELPPNLAEYSAIMSPNAFSGRLVRFEFQNGRAIVADKKVGTIPRDKPYPYGGEYLHLLPAAEIDIAGRKLVAHLDSGSKYGLNLPLSLVKQFPLKSPLVPHEPVRMIGGEHKAYTSTIDGSVRIGPLVLTNPEVMFVDGVPPFANVGIQVLKQLIIVLDPEEQRDWLLKE